MKTVNAEMDALQRELEALRAENRTLSARLAAMGRDHKTEEQQMLLDNITTHVFCLSDPATYGMVNQAHADFFGVARDALEDQNLNDLLSESEARLCIEGNTRIFETKEQIRTQEFLKGADGRRRLFEFTKTPRLNAHGEVAYVVCTGEDITERKNAERRLTFTQFTIDQAKIAVFWCNADGSFFYVNPTACEWLGYSFDELKQMHVADINPEFPREAWQAHWQEIKEKGLVHMESHHRRKNGEVYPVELYSNYVEFEGEEYKLSFVSDISERKSAEKELRRWKNYLANIIDSMPSILVGVDRRGRVIQWNHGAVEETGIDLDQAVGRQLAVLMPWMAPEMETVAASVRTKEVVVRQKRPRRRGEIVRYEDLTIFPLISNGVEGAVIRVDDVTERVRLEEMMVQGEKMLSVGGLAAGMAHEINNPLAGILQNVSLLENRLMGDLAANHKAADAAGTSLAAIRRYMELRKLEGTVTDIREAGTRAASIVKNMLSFARKSEKAVSNHDLGALLDQAVDLLKTDYDMKKHYDFKRINIIRQYDAGARLVPCAASKIQQVFMNILKNGAEAMAAQQGDGRPAPSFVLRVQNDGQWLGVEIEDNGPGMDAGTRRRIFEPFYTRKPGGTGLGLSISYFIITEDHGGEMSVHDAPGGGTRFTIRLPTSDAGR